MTYDRGFDAQQSYAIVDHIQRAAWDGKEDLVKVPVHSEVNLHGLTDEDIEEIPVPGGTRIMMPDMGTGNRAFDSMNLLTGILAGDSVSGDKEEVKVYYPHVRDGELKAKTVFSMTLSEAAVLLKRAAAANGIDTNLIKQAVSGMATRFTMFEQSQFDLHSNDIGMALTDRI